MNGSASVNPTLLTLDEDLKTILEDFNKFVQKEVEAKNNVLQIQIDTLIASNRVDSDKIDEIQAILARSSDLLEKGTSPKDFQSKIIKLKKKIREYKNELAETKESHMKQLFQVEEDKNRITESMRMEVEEEKKRLKQEGLHKELSERIIELESIVRSQEENFRLRLSAYEAKIQEHLKENDNLVTELSLLKEENDRLRERIKNLEVARMTYYPMTDDSDTKTVKKSGGKRKLFNPLVYHD